MTPATATRSHRGATVRAQGESLERELDAYHTDLAIRAIAWVRRVGTPVKVLGKVSQGERGRYYFRACFDGYQGADFVGFTYQGRHVAIEAKTHSGDGAWDSGIGPDGLAADGGALDPRQWEEVCMTSEFGGIAYVVLRAWGGTWAIMPDALAAHVRSKGRRTVRRDEIEHIGRRLVGVAWGG